MRRLLVTFVLLVAFLGCGNEAEDLRIELAAQESRVAAARRTLESEGIRLQTVRDSLIPAVF